MTITVNTQRAIDAHEHTDGLTRQQERAIGNNWRVMDAVTAWYKRHDWTHPPTVREIARLANVSTATTSAALRSLNRAGLVIYTGRARGLWLPEHD